MQLTTERPFELSHAEVLLGGRCVLHDVSVHLDPAEFVVVLGGNGSGKTTLVRALLGLVPLVEGNLKLFGKRAREFKDRSRIGYVPQRFTAASGVPATVFEVVLSGRVGRSRRPFGWRAEDVDRAREALTSVGLEDFSDRSAGALSGGQQQRVLIARALASEPDVLVLDEPVAGVDLEHQESFARLLADLHERGLAVLLVAHALGPMAPLVERAVVLEAGRVIHDGPPMPHQMHDEHVHHAGEIHEDLPAISPLDRSFRSGQ